MIRKYWFWVSWLMALSGVVRAEPIPIKQLMLQPAAVPSPALKYHLLPDLIDQSPGNAAPEYYRAYSPDWLTHRHPDMYQKFHHWLDLPPSQLPRKDLAWLSTYKPLQIVDQAARREYVDWDMTRRVRKEGYSLLLADMQGFRDFANLLRLRTELEIADGDYEKAVYSLQTGFALSRHLNEAPLLITGLIGNAVAYIMADQVEIFIQAPNAPNLYWALTDLPRPLVSFRKPFQGENVAFDSFVPSRKELEARTLSVQEARELMNRIGQYLPGLESPPGDRSNPPVNFALAAQVVKNYAPAKRFLLDSGRSPALIEAMSAPQVVLLYSRIQFDRLHDNLFKWLNLPFWQAHRGIVQAEREIAMARMRMEEGLPLASVLLPVVAKVVEAQARLERRLAALRVLEAIRLHAASHHGQLPAALKDITEVPIPNDPMTGKEFVYRVDGGKASLITPPPGAADWPPFDLHYEIMLKR